jgi:hypothetical protein
MREGAEHVGDVAALLVHVFEDGAGLVVYFGVI